MLLGMKYAEPTSGGGGGRFSSRAHCSALMTPFCRSTWRYCARARESPRRRPSTTNSLNVCPHSLSGMSAWSVAVSMFLRRVERV
jgi:hypothetical protein